MSRVRVHYNTLGLRLINKLLLILIQLLLRSDVFGIMVYILSRERSHAHLLSVHFRGAFGIRLHVQVIGDGPLSC